MDKLWLTWNELERKLKDKDIVLFGAGVEIVEKTIRNITKKPLYILDNSITMQGSRVNDIEIISPAELPIKRGSHIILITTTSYKSVVTQLEALGYKRGVDVYCSPILYNLKIEWDIKHNEQTLLISCSDGPNKESNSSGGGLYTFNTKTGEFIKHFSGRLRQIVKSEKYYYVADALAGIRVFNKDLELVDTINALPGSIMHGVAYNSDDNILFTANTGRDSVSIIDAQTGEHVEEIYISRKNSDEETDRHHINDICYYKGDLYVSMFSFSGLWKEGCYDGGVAKLSLTEKRVISYPVKDLWMPHTIDFIDGDIVIIDSMMGNVFKTSNQQLVNVNGFVRGLAYDGSFYYIGQSEHRHFDRLKRGTRTIHLNCGIHVYDEVNNVLRFYSLDNISNIHSILIKD